MLDMTLAWPGSGYFARMKVYLAEMYPIHKQLLAAVLLYAAFCIFMSRVSGVSVAFFSVYSAVGVGSLLALSLLTRLMDELKDKDVDEKLFGHRPLPSGRVLESDIRFTLIAVAVLYMVANVWTGWAFWMALVVLGYAMVMFKHFFMPRVLRDSLLLTLATHNPIVIVVYLYLLALFSVQHGLPLEEIHWPQAFSLILMYWAMSFAWEIARKIRSPEEENSYVTYSQILGPTGAVLVAFGAQTATFLLGLILHRALSFSPAFLAILGAGYVLTIVGYARFLWHPGPATSRLELFAEAYIVCVLAAAIAGGADVF